MQCAHQPKRPSSGRGMSSASSSESRARVVEEFAEVAERILQNVNAIFEKDQSLDEFDIIPQESQSNRSPVIHADHKLALESWCVPFLYTHSFRHFIDIRARGVQTKNSSTSKAAQNGSSTLQTSNIKITTLSSLSESERRTRALQLSRLLVLLNPDLSIAWNFRRQTFQSKYLKFGDELRLAFLCATRKPKSSEIFDYRRWLIQEAIKDGTVQMDLSLDFFQLECDSAWQAALKYFSNYHAWNYRLFLLDTWMKSIEVPEDLKMDIQKLEKDASDTWLKTHVSDYCGFHYRQKLLTYIFQSNGSSNPFFFRKELDENREMILFYPGHESLWYHRRNVIKQLADTVGKDNVDELKILRDSEYELVQLTTLEKEDNGDKCNLITTGRVPGFVATDCSQLNHIFSQRYLKWVKLCLSSITAS